MPTPKGLLTLLACLLALACGGSAAPAVVPLYQRRPQWADHAVLLSAVRASSEVTSLAFVAPVDGLPRPARPLLLAGDAGGAVHVLTTDGSLLASYDTGSGAAVTALAYYRLARNVTVVLSGHESGEVRLSLLRTPGIPTSTWDSAGDQPGEGRLRAELQLLSVLPPEELLCPLSAAAAAEAAAGAATSHQGAAGGCSPIVHLGLAGQRGSSAPELVTVQSAAGGVAVLRPRGRDRPEAVQVTVRVQAGTPLAAARAHLAQLTLLGPSGIAALPAGAAASAATARTASPGDLQWGACGGLNGSAVVAAVEQEPHGHAAYAVADDGRLLVLLLGGSGGKKGCQVRSAARLPAQLLSAGLLPQMPLLRLQLARSYLFLHTASHFAVFNCSDGPHSRKPPRLVLAQQLGQLSAEFLPPSEPPAAAQAEGTAAGAPAAAAAAETAPAAPQQPGVQLPSEGAGAGGGPRELLSSTSSSEPGVEAENPASGSGSEGCEQASREADACQACQSSGACEARFPPRAPAATAAPAALQRPTASLLAVDGGTGLVALGFGCGVVAVYESALPQRVRPPPPMAARLFQFLQPLAIVGVAGVVLWRARNKREAMLGPGPAFMPGGRPGGRIDGLADFERLLHGSTGGGGGRLGRPGGYRRFGTGPLEHSDEDEGPLARPGVPGASRAGAGGRELPRSSTRGAAVGEDDGRPRLSRLEQKLAERAAQKSRGAPPAAGGGPFDVAGPSSEEEEEEGGGGGAPAAAQRPARQPPVDYAPMQRPAGGVGPGAMGGGNALGSSDEEEDEEGPGGGSNGRTSAAALAELRRQYIVRGD